MLRAAGGPAARLDAAWLLLGKVADVVDDVTLDDAKQLRVGEPVLLTELLRQLGRIAAGEDVDRSLAAVRELDAHLENHACWFRHAGGRSVWVVPAGLWEGEENTPWHVPLRKKTAFLIFLREYSV